jgi:hypothetical protein
MIYIFIRNHENLFPIEKTCKSLLGGQSIYYQWKTLSVSDRNKQLSLLNKKKSINFDSKLHYGVSE